MQKGLKTLHIELGRHLYGGAHQVLHLMLGLVGRGHEAVLICPKGSESESEALKLGLTVYPIPAAGDLDVTLIFRLYKCIRKLNPDVLHLHSRRGADILGGLAGKLAKVPAVILSRRVDDPVKLGVVGKLKFNSLPHRVIAISEGISRVLQGVGIDKERISVVHDGILLSDFDDIRRDRAWFETQFGVYEDAPVIGTIAQLIERKGHRYLLSAIPGVLEKHPDARFIFLGEGPLRSELENIVGELNLGSVVQFAGFRDDILKILPNLDILVHPATREGLGVSLLQAAATGLPIIGCEAGGVPEVVKNEVTGLITPPFDSEALTKAIVRLLSDVQLRSALGEQAKAFVQAEFGIDQMVEGNLRVYEEVLSLNYEKARS